MLELAGQYHNAIMCGNAWSETKQEMELKAILNKICEYFGVDLDKTVDILNDCYEHIEDYAERYPDYAPQIKKFDRVIDELYNLIKKD
jgi:hypothetical protein